MSDLLDGLKYAESMLYDYGNEPAYIARQRIIARIRELERAQNAGAEPATKAAGATGGSCPGNEQVSHPAATVPVPRQLILDIQSNAATGEPEWSIIEDQLLRLATAPSITDAQDRTADNPTLRDERVAETRVPASSVTLTELLIELMCEDAIGHHSVRWSRVNAELLRDLALAGLRAAALFRSGPSEKEISVAEGVVDYAGLDSDAWVLARAVLRMAGKS